MARRKAIGIRADTAEKEEISSDAKLFGFDASGYLRFLHKIVGHPLAERVRNNADYRHQFWNMPALENLVKQGVVRGDFVEELKKRGGTAGTR